MGLIVKVNVLETVGERSWTRERYVSY